MKNKTSLVIILILMISLIVLPGCESKKAKIEKLKQSAQTCLEEGKFDDAIDLYNKILEIKEDAAIRDELFEIKYEKDSAEKTKVFMDDLYNLKQNKIRSGIKVSLTEMAEIEEDLDRIINDFEKIDDTKDTSIAGFVKIVKDGPGYILIKDVLENKIEDAGLSEGLGHLDAELRHANTKLVAIKRIAINKGIDGILKHTIPKKYDN